MTTIDELDASGPVTGGDEPTRPTCEDCVHYDPSRTLPKMGFCRVSPPSFVPQGNGLHTGQWPRVDGAKDWCARLEFFPITH